MIFLGITQKTADWLLRSEQSLKAISKELPALAATSALTEGVVSVGALRVAAHQKRVLCIWNTDYASSSGVEDWGFILLSTQYGLLSNETIYEEILERCLFIINQRLQGLILPDICIHRSLGNNVSSCIAGRGSAAYHFSIGYKEGVFNVGQYQAKSVLCVGPWGEGKDGLLARVEEQSNHIVDLLQQSNQLLLSASKRPALDSAMFRGLRQLFLPETARRKGDQESAIASVPQLDAISVAQEKVYTTLLWTYDDWCKDNSPLSDAQRNILENDIILKQPLRLIGAAGSGKTLLMQLLCIRRLHEAKKMNDPIRILYVVHNNEMAETVRNRFITLGASEYLEDGGQWSLTIDTLFGYAQKKLDLQATAVIDKDAYQTKLFQREAILNCLIKASKDHAQLITESKFIAQIVERSDKQLVYADLIANEIGVAIKGQDLGNNRQKYVTNEKPLSRMHGALNMKEREFIYDVYLAYHKAIFEEYEVLDSDDVALSLLGHLRTPLWEMKRKKEGFNFVFVDETQLFNENERSLLHLLTKGESKRVPVALALDEAQALNGGIASGFAALGIENLANQTLQIVQRSTKDILKLAFFLLQRTTDLFTADFPDFTADTITMVSSDHPLASKPRIVLQQDAQSIAKAVRREITALRRKNVRQIAVVVHADKYWTEIEEYFNKEEQQLPILIQAKRGQRIDPQTPIIVISRPETIGGQEFDAVIAVGLEKGIVPPIVTYHSGLQNTLEQQSLREMYLSFTRARYVLIVLNSNNSQPNTVLGAAVSSGLLE